jgi:hypothetical protein
MKRLLFKRDAGSFILVVFPVVSSCILMKRYKRVYGIDTRITSGITELYIDGVLYAFRAYCQISGFPFHVYAKVAYLFHFGINGK